MAGIRRKKPRIIKLTPGPMDPSLSATFRRGGKGGSKSKSKVKHIRKTGGAVKRKTGGTIKRKTGGRTSRKY